MYPTRRKRLTLRLSLLAMIGAGLIGAFTARTAWLQQMEQLSVVNQAESVASSGGFDWIELFATIGEAVIQLFVG